MHYILPSTEKDELLISHLLVLIDALGTDSQGRKPFIQHARNRYLIIKQLTNYSPEILGKFCIEVQAIHADISGNN